MPTSSFFTDSLPGISHCKEAWHSVIPCFVSAHEAYRDFPMLLVPQSPRLGRAWNRMSYRIAEQLAQWHPIRTLMNSFLREELGEPPFESFFGDARGCVCRSNLICTESAHSHFKTDRWNRWHHVTGYWFLDQTDGWAPPKG